MSCITNLKLREIILKVDVILLKTYLCSGVRTFFCKLITGVNSFIYSYSFRVTTLNYSTEYPLNLFTFKVIAMRPNTINILELLSNKNVTFYIPPYQRNYE